jgi:hypothetical protein
VIAAVVTYPYQVFRTRLMERPEGGQEKYRGLGDVFRRVMSQEGVRGFYKGLIPNILRVTPSSAITLATYEILIRWIGRTRRRQEE